MPEGPEIRRVRDRLAGVLVGERAEQIRFHLPALQSWNGRFHRVRIVDVEAHGKALITHLDNGYSIYSHNQLYGRWLITEPGELPSTRRQLRLAIETDRAWALLYSASDIEVWPSSRLCDHPFLKRLGPDLLDSATTLGTVLDRLLSSSFSGRQLGSLLTDQSFVAGLGNYLRCEILHCAGLHPRIRPGELPPGRLMALAARMLQLSRQSYRTGGITNDLARAEALRERGAGFEELRFHVFRREGLPCYRCGTPIVKERQGSQACYLCPECQQQQPGR